MKGTKNTAATVTTVEAPAKEAFAVKTHSKRSEVQGAARNRTIKGRGVTLYIGILEGKLYGNTTTQVDYLPGTKENSYRKFCSGQPSHDWMDKLMKAKGRDAFIYLGSDAMGTDKEWSPEQAAEVRSAVQKEISGAVDITWTGRLTAKGVPMPENAQEEISRAIALVKEFLVPVGAENEQATTEEKVEA